jgi:hypothetical protein
MELLQHVGMPEVHKRMNIRNVICATLAFGLLQACTGQIGGPQGDDNPGGSGSGAGTGSGPGATGGPGTTGGTGTTTGGTTTGGMPGACTTPDPQAPALHARLLSPSQYNNTVQDVLKVGGNPSKDFGGGAGTELDDLAVERRANAAADIARQAAAALASWSPCVPPAVAAATCEQQLIDRFGPLAFRHPITATERAQLKKLFDAGVTEKDFATGVEWFLTGVLQSPDFLYQFAKAIAGEMNGQFLRLPGFELASRLSFFIWDSSPDDQLYAAAAANELDDPAKLQTHVDRMLQDARFQRGITSFYTSWLQLDGLKEVARDDKAFTTDIVNALRTSVLMGATQLYTGAQANVSSLFSGSTYYMNDALRTFYGVSGTGTAFAPVNVAGEDRRGILTHPGLMALWGRPAETNPIARGLFVRQTLMCQDIPPPPDGVAIPPLPPIMPGLSTRDRLEAHVKVAFCASCHNVFDPPGYAFESFDQVGRHRLMDSGKAIDSSGTIIDGGDLEGPFAKGDDFLQKIANSKDVKGCFAQQYFQFAVSRPAVKLDSCSLEGLKQKFVPSGDLKELVATIAGSDSFRYRMSEGGAP